MRKMIDAEQKKTEKANKIMLLERECQELHKSVEELEQKIEHTKRIESEKLQKVRIRLCRTGTTTRTRSRRSGPTTTS